jgi:hypothetical protein
VSRLFVSRNVEDGNGNGAPGCCTAQGFDAFVFSYPILLWEVWTVSAC